VAELGLADNSTTTPSYRVICISLYIADLERLDEKVAQLKARGHSRASRSSLIRVALDQVNLDSVPRAP
jgi:hypothetical protein